ncbi:hypothetical protein EVAR_12623_1 [Eumeta japonica]|uniref:Uncharacterized protein n=1 Tax=Eumeta variegata TaxID=151549 RepID=A0A4C1UG71_EUMVA|nr:hypothetical protein EVAR_12623_1 [Eumeta japonica]
MEEFNIVLKNKIDNDFIRLFKPCQQIQALFSVNKYELRRHRVDRNSYRYLLTSVVVNAVVITNFYFVLSSYNFDTGHFIDYMSAVQIAIGFVVYCCANLINREKNLDLILILQDIHRKTKTEDPDLDLGSEPYPYVYPVSDSVVDFGPNIELDFGKETEKEVQALSFIWGFIFLATKESLVLILISAACEKVDCRIEELQRTCTILYEKRIDGNLAYDLPGKLCVLNTNYGC